MTIQLERGPSNLMPFTLGNPPKVSVGKFPNEFIFGMTYRTDRGVLEKMLPPGLEIADEPLVYFRYRWSSGIEWALGGEHKAVAVGAPVAYRKNGEEILGTFWFALWEDDPMAVILGRELFGVWKLCADIHHQLEVHGESRAMLSEVGNPMIELNFTPKAQITGTAFEELKAKAVSGGVFGAKRMPDVQDIHPSVDYLAYYPHRLTLTEAWAGEGNVKVFDTNPDVHIWLHHVVQSIAAIPLLECVSAMMTRGSAELYHGEGRVLPL